VGVPQNALVLIANFWQLLLLLICTKAQRKLWLVHDYYYYDMQVAFAKVSTIHMSNSSQSIAIFLTNLMQIY
jgi:hypothetical protein